MPYVYAIRDPRIKEEKNIVFIGSGNYPWESVARHLEKSSNPKVAEWALGLHRDFPEGIEILGRVVADRWHGEKIAVPDPKPGITRVQWDILAFDERTGPDADGNQIVGGSAKAYWIERLGREGHPILNRRVGRPRTHPNREGVPLAINHVTEDRNRVP